MDAAELPLLPSGQLPPAPLLLRWLEGRRRAGATAVLLSDLPPANGALPDLLRLGGIERCRCAAAPLDVLRWEGSGGGRVELGGAGVGEGDQEPPLHCGPLPASGGSRSSDDAAIHALVDLARLEDAAGALGRGPGAAWEHILAALGHPVSLPPLLAGSADADQELGAWNPLPIARRCVCELPCPEPAPWSVVDTAGRMHPVQVVEGVAGRRLLVSLPLGALECMPLSGDDEPCPGCHWEVSPRLLDNGRVRIELDAEGRIERLCWDGVFADLAGPAVQPLIDGAGLAGDVQVAVLEDGPVRARVAVTRSSSAGTLHLSYTLHAFADHCEVAASWSGDGELWLDHPTAQRGPNLHVAGECARWAVAQAANVLRQAPIPAAGVRWAALADPGGRGLALAAGRPLTVRAEAGHLQIAVPGSVAWALAAPRRPRQALSLGALAQHLAAPGRPFRGSHRLPPPFRLADAGGLVALWARGADGWAGELLLADQLGARGRACFFPRRVLGPEAVCWKVDAAGNRLAALPSTPEGDGWHLDHGPGEVMIVRWRC